MDTKEQLIKAIQGWVRLDNEIRKLKKEEQLRKDEQKKLSTDLMDIMRKNEIDEVDINNGKLIYSKKNVKKPITKKALLGILSKFYKGDIAKATEINDFILDYNKSLDNLYVGIEDIRLFSKNMGTFETLYFNGNRVLHTENIMIEHGIIDFKISPNKQ